MPDAWAQTDRCNGLFSSICDAASRVRESSSDEPDAVVVGVQSGVEGATAGWQRLQLPGQRRDGLTFNLDAKQRSATPVTMETLTAQLFVAIALDGEVEAPTHMGGRSTNLLETEPRWIAGRR